MKLVFGNQPRTHWWCEVLSVYYYYYSYFYPISSFFGQRCNQSKGLREIDCFIEQEFSFIDSAVGKTQWKQNLWDFKHGWRFSNGGSECEYDVYKFESYKSFLPY
jgi:hypothetical protein